VMDLHPFFDIQTGPYYIHVLRSSPTDVSLLFMSCYSMSS
jgi:hypothetical protein